MEKAGKLKRVPFKDRAEMKKLVDPVMAAYAKEIGADGDLGEDQRRQVKLSSELSVSQCADPAGADALVARVRLSASGSTGMTRSAQRNAGRP